MKKSINLFSKTAFLLVVFNAIFMASCEQEVRTETVTEFEEVLVTVGDSLPEGIYKEKVFDDIKPPVTMQYGSESYHQATFFEPATCVKEARPLVILAPGGGWARYTEVPRLTVLATDLSLRGYTVAIVQYALGQQGFDTYLKATQDIRSAVRFFKINAPYLNIDPQNIFTGGWSTGAQMSLAAAFIENDEIALINQDIMRQGLQSSISSFGFDNNDNPGVDNKVRGAVICFATMPDTVFFQSEGPALMMINHDKSHFSDGTKVIGFVNHNGVDVYGTDMINEQTKRVSYVEGQDLEYIRLSGTPLYGGFNEASLASEYWDQIAEFMHRNMKID